MCNKKNPSIAARARLNKVFLAQPKLISSAFSYAKPNFCSAKFNHFGQQQDMARKA
jgi:hypothetical protein